MRDEATVEEMRGLHFQEPIGQLGFKKDMLVRCQPMLYLPIAPKYCVHGAEKDTGQGGALAD